jgi:type II secretory ATPase GspE/PulE/Tfp pilus assembly ATPase PilB-like protein/CheY-like chemotaxis protein
MKSKTPPVPGATWPDVWLEKPLRDLGVLRDEHMKRLRDSGKPTLWQAAVALGLTNHQTLLTELSRRFAMQIADRALPDPGMSNEIPEKVARELNVVPLGITGRVLQVACVDPVDHELEQKVAFAAGRRVRLVLTDPDTLAVWQDAIYPRGQAASDLVEDVGPLSSGEGLLREVAAMSEGELPAVSTSKLVDALLVKAIRQRASDLHLEPHETTFGVRYRIDGTLHEVARLPRALHAPVTSRLKVLANLDIADRIRPQDGRAQIQLAGRKVDLRVSTLPTGNLGEKTVIRILDSGNQPHTFASLGLLPDELNRLETLFRYNEGLVLVTGPTGSGKTTTLYTALRSVQTTGVNIVTVEDPIEYRLEGISQVQINERAGLTFATVLRSILRQDPDVVLVGEIRDRETAEVALQASMTGHFVLSTLHTNDAPSSIMRLLDMDVEKAPLAGALRGVIAQRLLRRVCPQCRARCDISDLAATQRALLERLPNVDLYEARGCDACNGVGYRGRLVVPEILIITDDIARAIARGVEFSELVALCKQGGMRTLWEAGLQRVALGLTTLNELLDNITPPATVTAANTTDAIQADVDAVFQTFGRTAPPKAAHHEQPKVGEVPRIPRSSSSTQSAPAGLRVLIADDDASARQELRRGLEREGFRVLEVADGQAALEYIQRLKPALALIELALPKLDGLGLLRAVGAETGLETTMIILTAQDDPDLAVWAMELGAADVLVKPVEPRLLAQRLKTLAKVAA